MSVLIETDPFMTVSRVQPASLPPIVPWFVVIVIRLMSFVFMPLVLVMFVLVMFVLVLPVLGLGLGLRLVVLG